MSRQLDIALDNVGRSMTQLRDAVKGIPYRREGFKTLHDDFARSVADLTTALSYARGMLDEEAAARRKKARSR
ncbi:hypothetical protein ACQPW3_39600 [Actinosynnema sp. CA-248983]